VSQGNLSYSKIHPLHSLFKGCTEDHYNHCSLNTFYPAKTILFLHLQWCLHNAPSNPETTDWWSIFNPASNRLVTVFHRPSNTTSPTKHTTHQDSDLKCFPLFPRNTMQWRPLLPKGGGLIQVDIGGHPPVPTSSFC
jgi:hypothetical protein